MIYANALSYSKLLLCLWVRYGWDNAITYTAVQNQ